MKSFWLGLFLLISIVSVTAQEPTALPANVSIYVVQRGDSLWRIARDAGIEVEFLATLNGIPNGSGIQVGQRLLIPTSSEPIASVSTSVPIPVLPPVDMLHTVVSGDTVGRLALRYGVTVQSIVQANSLTDPSLIYSGQQLIIPGIAPTLVGGDYPPPITAVIAKPSTTFIEGDTGSLTILTSSRASVSVSYLGEPVPVSSDSIGTTHYATFGIPAFTQAGAYPLQITTGTVSYTLDTLVQAGGYLTTNINVTSDQTALLDPAVEEFERETLRAITSRFTPEKRYTGAFGLPAAASMNAPFGTRRSYNGGAVTRYHSGADFAAPPGSPVYVAASGTVVLADLLNIRGNCIVIDHGWGIYTAYAHLTTINVALGQTVEVGQIIATSGSTGRVTGPHLHWELWVMGVPVDPIQWTQITFP